MAIKKILPALVRTKDHDVNKAIEQSIKALQSIHRFGIFTNDNGDIVISKDIHCRSIFLESESLYIGGVKISKPTDSEDGYYLQYDKASKKFTYQSTSTPTTESVQDIVGAMFSGNTETLVTVTYQDSDGTIDVVVDEASIDHDALTNYVANEHIAMPDIVCSGGDVVTSGGEVVWQS